MATPGPGPAFLLAQIGSHAAARFAERLAPLGLSPAHAGILWNVSKQPDITQRALADLLGSFPSRLSLVIDELEDKGLLERRARPDDRRSHALRLTRTGKAKLEQIARIGREHQDALCAALDAGERSQLRELLVKIATQQELRPSVHPGFRKL